MIEEKFFGVVEDYDHNDYLAVMQLDQGVGYDNMLTKSLIGYLVDNGIVVHKADRPVVIVNHETYQISSWSLPVEDSILSSFEQILAKIKEVGSEAVIYGMFQTFRYGAELPFPPEERNPDAEQSLTERRLIRMVAIPHPS